MTRANRRDASIVNIVDKSQLRSGLCLSPPLLRASPPPLLISDKFGIDDKSAGPCLAGLALFGVEAIFCNPFTCRSRLISFSFQVRFTHFRSSSFHSPRLRSQNPHETRSHRTRFQKQQTCNAPSSARQLPLPSQTDCVSLSQLGGRSKDEFVADTMNGDDMSWHRRCILDLFRWQSYISRLLHSLILRFSASNII